jgi:L-alanine-DL-glutamate epimerase-like enolase superfamily enzyme
MRSTRRQFLERTAAAAGALAAFGPRGAGAAETTRPYPYHGRSDDYAELRVIEPGRTIDKIETFTKGSVGVVCLTTSDGKQGYGQVSTFDADITVQVLHRKLARLVLGDDPARIDAIADRSIEANYKFPWSFVCRALAGIDTAIWDLYGKIKGKPVCQLIGGARKAIPAYGSSMRRDIAPADEAARLARLRDQHGFRAFKVRVGRENGHDQDASPGRTEQLIPAVRKALGDGVKLLADANSCYTPPRAIEVGRLLEQHHGCHFEEPCPYWELEWTAEVVAALDVPVAGGEQDNDLAQWRRMFRLNAVDIAQPDICYIGGFTRALRVARMAHRAGKLVVPHSANLSLVTVFTLHLLAAIPNAGPHVEFTIEEGGELNQPFYRPRLEVNDGAVAVPDAPGWGVEIDAAWLQSASYQKSER